MWGRSEVSEDFSFQAGKPFAKVFDTERGQVAVTIEANDDGNAALFFRSWTAEGFAEFSLGVSGVRAPQTDKHFAAMFDGLDAEKVSLAWDRALGGPQ
jgi:hypothetical protein